MAQRFAVCDVLLGGFNQWCFYTLWQRREKAVYVASQKDTEAIILHYTNKCQHLEDLHKSAIRDLQKDWTECLRNARASHMYQAKQLTSKQASCDDLVKQNRAQKKMIENLLNERSIMWHKRDSAQAKALKLERTMEQLENKMERLPPHGTYWQEPAIEAESKVHVLQCLNRRLATNDSDFAPEVDEECEFYAETDEELGDSDSDWIPEDLSSDSD